MIKINISSEMVWYKLDELIPSQGNLKELTKENYERLRAEIERNGFTSPFYIWMNEQDVPEILDGHQRQLTLSQMRSEGVVIPSEFPCVVIEAESRQEASRILLALTSQYGTMTTQGLYEYANENEISIGEMVKRFNFAQFPMAKFEEEFYDRGSLGVDDFEDNVEPTVKEPKLCPHCGLIV